MKRFLSLFTSLIMAISLLGVMPAMTAGAETSGDYEYYILSDGTVEITKYYGSAKTLAIPSTIAGKKVSSIADWAFSGCSSLISVTIPNSVKSIGEMSFYSCSRLTNITIPNSVKRIGNLAFSNCINLKVITIPSSVTSIGSIPFERCSNLTSITVDSNNNYYSSQNGVLFNKNKTILIQYPIGNTRKSYNIPNIVTRIGDKAFWDCSSLTSVTIPKSVKSIGSSAFEACVNLTYITISNSVTSIENGAFYRCSSIKDVYYTGSKSEWNKIKIGDYNSDLTNATIHFNTPAVVNGFKVSATSANAVKLSWSKVSGANGYIVYRYNTSTKKWVRIAKTASLTFTDKNLKSGTSYKYAIREYKTVNGKEILSPSYPTVTTSTNPATVSFKLTAGSKKATVKWSKVTGATGYKIYYKTSANGKWVGLKTVNNKTTSYTKTGLAKGKTYYFTVKAYRTVGGKTYNGTFVTKSVKVK